MSFGPKLCELPVQCPPGEEILVTLSFVPDEEVFEREVEIYVEEPIGIRTINLTIRSAHREFAL